MPEREEEVTCTSNEVQVIPVYELQTYITFTRLLAPAKVNRDAQVAQLQEYLDNVMADTDVSCDFTGETLVGYEDGMRTWLCPRCGYVNQTDISDDIAEMRLSADERDRL